MRTSRIEAEVAQLVRAVATASVDRDQVAERFARARWSGLAEPGDGDVGRLLRAVGAPRALDLVEEADKSAIELALRDAGEEPVGVRDALARWQPRLGEIRTEAQLQQAARFGATLLVPGDDDWPEGVDDLGDHAPSALWVRGDAQLLGRLHRSIAVVGARAATGYGEHVTVEASSGLVDRGFAIVSGAAYGIDGAAHRAALAGGGATVAFLAGGADRFYPSGHETLLSRIVERGAVVSEVPPGTAPTKWRFLQRNRLIAAASAATVVVEAGWRSGSLNTAGHAAALGRPLGAVPGPVTSSASAGCHRLIREYDAVCVTSAAEMAALVGDPEPEPPTAAERRDSARIRVLDALSVASPRPVSRVAALAGLSIDAVRAQLGLLELDELVRETPGGWRRRSPS